MKIKLFTHNDLDGVGCGVLCEVAYKDNINIEYCDYDGSENINVKVKNFILSKEYEEYDMIFITDISVNEEVAELINDNIEAKHIQLLDHHNTAKWLNDKYEWSKVLECVEDGIKHCGTMMFYYELLDIGINFIDSVFNFAEMVRRYDTWEWKTVFKDNNSKQLNDLLRLYGRDKFIQKMVVKLNNNKYIFDENDKLVLELEQEKIKRYIEDKNTKIIPKVIKGFNVGIVFAEQYISELGNILAELNPHLDFIAMINMSTVSYRGIKENIDLGQFAKLYGGGGHPKASGSQVSDEIRNKIIDLIFN